MHPLVNFIYFLFVLVFGMCLMNPYTLGISFIAAFINSYRIMDTEDFRRTIIWFLGLMVFAAIINPLFSHEGITIIMYFPSGNPLTLESIYYGLGASFMIGSIALWFTCFNRVITSDKFIYLFGKLSPALSLLLSMALRFVPRFKKELIVVKDAQSVLGKGIDKSAGNWYVRLKNAISIISIMITWSMENAIETADSMKSRGYGQAKRTFFNIYCWHEEDKESLVVISFLGLYVIAGWILKAFYFRYYPSIKFGEFSALNISFYIAYGILLMIPVIIDCLEERRWKLLKSRI